MSAAPELPPPSPDITRLDSPDDLRRLLKYCGQNAAENIGEVVATLEKFLADAAVSIPHRLTLYALCILHGEHWERHRCGLSARNAASIADMQFQFTTEKIKAWKSLSDEWCAGVPATYDVLRMRALSALAAGSEQEAETYYAAMRGLGADDPASVTHFDSAFHGRLTEADLDRDLPPVVSVREVQPEYERIVYFACNYAYFKRYGWAQAASFVETMGPGVSLHMHLYDVLDSEMRSLLGFLSQGKRRLISVSTEWTNLRDRNAPAEVTQAAKNYYHVARFPRFWRFLEERPRASAWQLDADFLFTGAADRLFNLLGAHDAGLLLLPGRLESHSKIAAGLVGIGPTARGRRYLGHVAAYIMECLRAGPVPWGTDQAALYCGYLALATRGTAPSVAAVPTDIYNGRCSEGTLIWPIKPLPQKSLDPALRSRLEMLKSGLNMSISSPPA